MIDFQITFQNDQVLIRNYIKMSLTSRVMFRNFYDNLNPKQHFFPLQTLITACCHVQYNYEFFILSVSCDIGYILFYIGIYLICQAVVAWPLARCNFKLRVPFIRLSRPLSRETTQIFRFFHHHCSTIFCNLLWCERLVTKVNIQNASSNNEIQTVIDLFNKISKLITKEPYLPLPKGMLSLRPQLTVFSAVRRALVAILITDG